MMNTMKKLHKFIKNRWNIILGTLLLVGLVVYYGVSNHFIQIFHYDMIEQYVRFIQRGYDLIRTPGIEWWDFNHFLGSSVFAYGYYFLFSPFWLIFAVLPSKEMIPQAMLFVDVFKLWVLFLSSSYYVSKLTEDRLARFVGASIITFSGFIMGYYQYGFYTDALVFLPLMLAGVEVYLKDNKRTLLMLSVFASAIVNVYLFVLFTVYVFLYTLFRYLILNPQSTVKETLLKALHFLLVYGLGIGCAAVFVWPNLRLLLSSSRIESSTDGILIDFNLLFRYVTSWIMPIVDRNDFNPFISKTISTTYGYSGGAALYSLIVSPLFLTQVLGLKRSKEKTLIQMFYGLLWLIAFFPPLYFLLQGNSDTRWMVMFSLLNAYTVVLLMKDRQTFNPWIMLGTAMTLGAVLSASYIYSLRSALQPTRIYYDIAKRNIVLIACLVGLYVVGTFFRKNRRIQTFLYGTAIVFEISLVLGNIFFNPVISISMTAKQFNESSIQDFEVIDKIKTEDSGLYRIEVIQESGYNDPQSKDYLGMTFYSSVYNYNSDGFIQNNLASAGGWLVGNNTGKWMVKNLLGSKYWATDMAKPYSVPFGYEPAWAVQQDDITYVVFKNRYAAPLMYVQHTTVSTDAWNQLSALDKTRVISNSVVVDSSTHTQINFSDSMQKLADFKTDIRYSLDEPTKDKVITVEFPRSEEVRIQLLDKGIVVKDFYSYEPQYSSVYSEVDFDTIVVHVSNLWGVPDEEFINTLSIQDPKTDMEAWYSAITKDNFEVSLGLNSFKAFGQASQDEWIVTSIAYDPDWSVWVNGQKVKVEKVNGGFIGFQVNQGTVSINASYFPKALWQGGLISALSGVYWVYWVFTHRGRHT